LLESALSLSATTNYTVGLSALVAQLVTIQLADGATVALIQYFLQLHQLLAAAVA
jgi:hypothetical protein